MTHLRFPAAVLAFCLLSPVCPAQSTPENTSSLIIPDCFIDLADERELAFGQTGIVAQVYVREGDRVKKGQLLAELDAAVPKASLAVAEKQAENDVNIRFARAAARVADVAYRSVQQAVERSRRSFSAVEVEKSRLERDRSVVEIEVARHEFDVNHLKRDEAAALVDSYQIISPMDGVVTELNKSPGEAVQSGETLLHCENAQTLHVECDASIRLIRHLKTGRQVRVIPMKPGQLETDPARATDGKIIFVAVQADLGSETMRMVVEVDNREGLLLAGTSAVVELTAVSQEEESVSLARPNDLD